MYEYDAYPTTHRLGGHPPDCFVTSTIMLARILGPLIERYSDIPRGLDVPRVGGIKTLADMASPVLGQQRHGKRSFIKPDSLNRRIWSIMNGETLATSITIADALLLGCDIYIRHTDLPTLPAGLPAAKEMVTIRAELKGWPLDELTIHREATRVLDFTREFLPKACVSQLEDAPHWIAA